MLTATQEREQNAATAKVSELMRKYKVSLADLIETDLKSPKARRVEKCWSLMSQLGISYAVLENAASTPGSFDAASERFHEHYGRPLNSGLEGDDQ